jgi:hypothetical protein
MPRILATSALVLASFLAACAAESDPAPPASAANDGGVQQFPLMRGEGAGFVTFAATKEEGIEVAGRLFASAGSLEAKGGDVASLRGGIDVGLETVGTGDPTRDKNLREVLFGLADGARGIARVDVVSLVPEQAVLQPKERTHAAATLKVQLLGGTATVPASVEVGRVDEARWSVRTLAPVELSLDALGMAGQVAALTQKCGHKEIGDSVTVNFVLGFAR